MSANWRKLGTWNVGTPDGNTEKFSLYEDANTGSFRVQNDFGNITIDMERMSGYEFFKRVTERIEQEITSHSDDDGWMYAFNIDDDCDGLTPGP